MSDQPRISLDKLGQYINTKRDLYEAAHRNGLYLPKLSSSIVTEEYIV